LTCKIRVKVQS